MSREGKLQALVCDILPSGKVPESDDRSEPRTETETRDGIASETGQF